MATLTTITSKENASFNYDFRFNILTNLIRNESVLINKSENIYYLTGFKGSAGRLVIHEAQKYLFVDSRYFEYACDCSHKTNVVLVENSYNASLLELLKQKNISAISIAKEGLTLVEYEDIKKSLLEASITLNLLSAKIDEMRLSKDKEEINIIKDNLNRAEAAMTKTLPYLKEGVSEQDIAAELEYKMRCEGGDKTAFDTILLFGERSSLPHGVPSSRKLKKGDLVLMDFGLSRTNYKSDITRTFFFGKGEHFEQMSKVYNVVKEAHARAIEGIHTGITGKEADALARDIIKSHNLGEYFGHGLGHGVGLEIHELPRLSSATDVTLPSASIVTVEPGVYMPKIGGVRIENMVIVTKDRGVSLNITPTDLIVL